MWYISHQMNKERYIQYAMVVIDTLFPRKLYLPPEYPVRSTEFLAELNNRFLESQNLLCGTTLDLLMIAILAKKFEPDDPGTKLMKIEVIPGSDTEHLYIPDPWDRAYTPWIQGYDFAILKSGIGTPLTGIAYVSGLPAVFVVHKPYPQESYLAVDRVLNARPFNPECLTKYTSLSTPAIGLIARKFAGTLLSIELLPSLLADYGVNLPFENIPFTVSAEVSNLIAASHNS